MLWRVSFVTTTELGKASIAADSVKSEEEEAEESGRQLNQGMWVPEEVREGGSQEVSMELDPVASVQSVIRQQGDEKLIEIVDEAGLLLEAEREEQTEEDQAPMPLVSVTRVTKSASVAVGTADRCLLAVRCNVGGCG